ncbi:SseB family protein [Zafaria sp. J156]|nr:SseB family protein [Zafaria sp. J156]MEE1622345.1 SseB family protein [Zafaria sp. J156]
MSETPSTESPADYDPAVPHTHLETILVAGQEDPARAGEVIATFLQEEVFFLSREEVAADTQNVQPLLLQNADGQPLIALFTDVRRIPGTYIDTAPFAVRVVGAAVVDNLSGAGLVINPGHPVGFEIGPDGVDAIRRDFRPDGSQEGPQEG